MSTSVLSLQGGPVRRPNPVMLWGVALGGLAVAVAIRVAAPHAPPYVGLSAHAFALLFVWAGVIAWARRPEYRFGKIMVLVGAAWFLKLAVFVPNAFAFTISYTWQDFFDPLLAYLVLTFPTGRLQSKVGARIFWAYVLVMYALWWPVTMLLSPRKIPFPDFSPFGIHVHPVNLLSIHPVHAYVNTANYIWVPDWFGAYSGPAFLAVVLTFAFVRWYRASSPRRRFMAPAIIPVAFTMLCTIVAYVLLNLVRSDSHVLSRFVAWLNRAGIYSWFALPIGFLLGLYLERRAQAGVGKLVVELDELPGLHELEGSLRRVLHDPSLRVGFYDRDTRTYRAADGAPFDIEEDAEHLVATALERGGTPLGVMVHDQALLENPQLMEATAAAVRMAVDNDRLNAAVRAQLEEVRASRARIVEASDAERKRIERNLHDGAQQRLVSLAMSLRVAQSKAEMTGNTALIAELDQSAAALDRAIAELRELAQGIHPAVLSEEGLSAALHDLAETSPVPVRLFVDDVRYPEPVEATAYFLIAEALANVAKHARATHIDLHAQSVGETLVVQIIDDGVGGADATNGSGLRGLDDRVAALGGTLSVESPAGGGTRLTAKLPCASRSPTIRS